MKYKVGDTVKVRDNLKVGENYGNDTFVSMMTPYKTITIKYIDDKENKYRVRENTFKYTDEMLEELIEELKPSFEITGIQELEANNPNKFYIINVKQTLLDIKYLTLFRDTIQEKLGTTNFLINVGELLNIAEEKLNE